MIIDAAPEFITLAEAKAHLRKPAAAGPDDDALEGFISAACRMIVDRVGQVSPVTCIETVTVCRGTALLRHRPVLSVTTPAGWTVTNPEGIIEAPGAAGPVEVAYEAGRDPIPGTIRLAALELVAHLWQGSQHADGAGGRPMLQGDGVTIPGIAYALPHRVRELLGLGKGMTDEPLVG